MTTERTVPVLPKWPFVAGDLLLLLAAGILVYEGPAPLKEWQSGLVVLAVGVGAWLAVTPFLLSYRAQMRLLEVDTVADTVSRIQDLDRIAAQVSTATAQWQAIQDQAATMNQASRHVADEIGGYVRSFSEALQRANDVEKAHLRLEVEKLRRAESDWMQVVIRILDNVFALHQAAVRSGHPALIEQLTTFQAVCRDLARRIGLVAVIPAAEEGFDGKLHQLPDGSPDAPSGARLTGVLMPGFSFQGQLLRRAVVLIPGLQLPGDAPTPASAPAPAPAPSPEPPPAPAGARAPGAAEEMGH